MFSSSSISSFSWLWVLFHWGGHLVVPIRQTNLAGHTIEIMVGDKEKQSLFTTVIMPKIFSLFSYTASVGVNCSPFIALLINMVKEAQRNSDELLTRVIKDEKTKNSGRKPDKNDTITKKKQKLGE